MVELRDFFEELTPEYAFALVCLAIHLTAMSVALLCFILRWIEMEHGMPKPKPPTRQEVDAALKPLLPLIHLRPGELEAREMA